MYVPNLQKNLHERDPILLLENKDKKVHTVPGSLLADELTEINKVLDSKSPNCTHAIKTVLMAVLRLVIIEILAPGK